MAQDNATVNLYINNTQAVESVKQLENSYQQLKKARKEADSSGDIQKSLDLQAKERVALSQLREAKKGQLDIEKALQNINKISTSQLLDVRRKLTSELKVLNRDTEEYITKKRQLTKIEEEYRAATARTNVEQQKSTGFLSRLTPTVDIGGMLSRALGYAKDLVAEVWNVSMRLQGDAKKAATVFGDELGYVEYQATKVSKAMGLTNAEYVAMVANAADLLVPLGFTRKESAQMSVELQSLTGALNEWSSNKYGAAKVSARLTNAVLGEVESLKELGISIRLDSAEYKDLVKQKLKDQSVTEGQARAMATLELITAKTEDAQAGYVASGNGLLRFQNSAARGWRGMIEAIGEWFAFSDLERAERAHRIYSELSVEFEKNESTLGNLVPRYEELTSKAELNAAEQEELRKVINEIVAITPGAASGFDKYGTVLGINTAAVHAHVEAQRLLKKEMSKDIIEDQVATLAELNRKLYIKERAEWAAEIGTENKDEKSRAGAYESLNRARLRQIEYRKEIAKTVSVLLQLGLTLDDISKGTEKWASNAPRRSSEELEEWIATYNKVEKVQAGGGGKDAVADYDLSKDQAYNEAKISLKQQLRDGLIATEEEYNRKVLSLEVNLLKQQIASGKYSADQVAKLQSELLDKELSQAKDARARKARAIADAQKEEAELLKKQAEEQKRTQKLQDISDRSGSALSIAEKEYADRLKSLDLFNRDVSEMTEVEKSALLQLEKEHGLKLSSIQHDEFNRRLTSRRSAMDAELLQIKVAQAEELDSAKSLSDLKQILSRSHSGAELQLVTEFAQAKAMVLKMYDKEQAEYTARELADMIAVYQSAIEQMSSTGSLFGESVNMTEEDLKKLEQIIQNLKLELASLRDGEDSEDSKDPKAKRKRGKGKVDILGMSADDWNDLLENLKNGEGHLDAVLATANAIGGAFSTVSDLMTSLAQRELAEFEESQSNKKSALERRLANGLISESYYNEQVQKLDEETDQKKQQIEREQAQRDKALAIFNAIINTAQGVTAALGVAPPLGFILAGLVGALGAVQIAAIAAQPLPGLESGGFMDVVRSQDGARYSAQYNPGARGYVGGPTVIVGENGREFVASNRATLNPTVRPVLDIIDHAQRSGQISQLNLPQAMRGAVPGFERGGYLSNRPGVQSRKAAAGGADLTDLYRLIAKLNARLDRPIVAHVSVDGENGINRKLEEYDKQTKRTRIQ